MMWTIISALSAIASSFKNPLSIIFVYFLLKLCEASIGGGWDGPVDYQEHSEADDGSQVVERNFGQS